MSELLSPLSTLLILGGAFFLFAGTVGLIRFPDAHSRLHALSKVDNLGLGMISFGLVFQAKDWTIAAKIIVIWTMALLASSLACLLIANWKTQNDDER